MAVDIKNLIAAIAPDVYCDSRVRTEVKELAQKGEYLKAAEKAKLKESDYLDIYHTLRTKGAFEKIGLKFPIEEHNLLYDAFSQSLEQIYFWILDYVNAVYGGSEKLVDNFVSSSGGGYFAEMQARATRMQEEGMKVFGTVNTVLRSILNLIYDLKEFQLKLEPYFGLKSTDDKIKEASKLSLKQVWMDSVDIKRGTGSINGLAQQLEFVTIRDAFLVAKSVKDVDDIDLNERVKRILKPRIMEFEKWVAESESSLKKRYEVEKIYLKSQVNSLRMYARWVKPYLKAAKELEQRAKQSASLVNVFNTVLFELVLLAKGQYDMETDILSGELPKAFRGMGLRKYHPITIIEFSFRSAPERMQQQGAYGFRGRADVKFTSFALNDGELEVLREQIAEDDFGDVYKMIEGATDESLDQIKDDLEELLGGKIGQKKDKEEVEEEDVNPFAALFSFARREKKNEKGKGIKKDSENEKILRSQAILVARIACRKLYDDYKKAHEMPAFPPAVE